LHLASSANTDNSPTTAPAVTAVIAVLSVGMIDVHTTTTLMTGCSSLDMVVVVRKEEAVAVAVVVAAPRRGSMSRAKSADVMDILPRTAGTDGLMVMTTLSKEKELMLLPMA
jgi:hypothetical protein